MTPERENKLKKVIATKQSNLTIIMENIDDPHNISACLRSCDAVGVKEVYILDSNEYTAERLGKKSSASATKWLDIHKFTDIDECFAAVRAKYDKIYSTHLSTESKSLHELDLAASVALVFGNEKDGVTQDALDRSDGNFIIPQYGLIQSLNVSVACAVSLYEALRQRTNAGMYENGPMTAAEQSDLFSDWSER